MAPRIPVNPAALRQFSAPRNEFCLITDPELGQLLTLGDSDFATSSIKIVEPGGSLAATIAELSPDAAVLVAAPGLFVRSEDLADLRGRQVSIMPCGSTPVLREHVEHFLAVLERTDPVAQAERADRFFDAVGDAGQLVLSDAKAGTQCVFDPAGGDYEWNQQAGMIGPGEQQIAPAGELSVLPMEITDFDPDRRLAMNGTLTLRGEAIVHAGYDPAMAGTQAALYEELADVRSTPVTIEVVEGVITEVKGDGRAAAALVALFDVDERYRPVWELGFGINDSMSVVEANCGLNEVFGGSNGVVHLGIGLTPFTQFALTFLCPDTTLTDQNGAVLLGKRRIMRTRDASCGCH